MYGIGYISPSVNQTLTPSATLCAPGDMYIITDTRRRPRKDLTETKAFQRYDIRTLNAEELAKMQAEDPLLYEQIKADMSTSGNANTLGKPTIKFEFEDNAALADFLHATNKAADFADFEDVTNTATSAKANAPKSKIRNSKLMPADDSRYLPESVSPYSLPPAPTSPTVPPLPSFDTAFDSNKLKDSYFVDHGFSVGGSGYIKDGWKYYDIYIPRNYMVVGNLLDYGESLFPGFVSVICFVSPKDGKWVFVLSNKYKDFVFKYYSYKTQGVIYGRENIFIHGIPLMEKLVKAFEDNGLQVIFLYRHIIEDSKPATSPTSTAKALPPYVEPTPAPTSTQSGKTVKFTPQKTKTVKPLEIENNGFSIGRSGVPYVDVYFSNDARIQDIWNWANKYYNYGGLIALGEWDTTTDGSRTKYKFYFQDKNKMEVLKYLLNPTKYEHVGDHIIIRNLADIKRINYGDGSNVHLTVIRPHIVDQGLGKPTIKFEFEDNAELLSLFDTDGISGMTVNDKSADIFNCPESQLQTRGYKTTYIRLNDYSHLIDTADGRKTLKGYGFESATLDELVNACRYYPQVAALAAHLKDPSGDALQTAFNDWHWLHTNIRYDYDTPGQEEIRTPARVWRDRFSGVDCDCLAVMTACLLINQGFHPCFEIVAFNNEPTFSHIYVNLDGAAIDRVLPVFLARPDNITKTQIMDIPVYSLSGIGGCRDTLSGVYASTLAKIQNGTATGEDNNDFRKTQVLVTLRGIDDAAYSLAALLMPHVVTIADDGTYYFDSTAMANLATKLDGDLAALIAENADAYTISQWIANAATQIDGAASVASNGGNDTVVVIINPKGDLTRVIGQMAKGDTPNLTDTTADAINTPAAASSTPAIMQTSPVPGVAPDGETESDSSDWWKYALAAAAAFGAGAMVTKSSKKTKKRK